MTETETLAYVANRKRQRLLEEAARCKRLDRIDLNVYRLGIEGALVLRDLLGCELDPGTFATPIALWGFSDASEAEVYALLELRDEAYEAYEAAKVLQTA